MASSIEHRPLLIERLYSNCKEAKGTDLEVECPKKLHEPELETFHLHSCIVAESSDYFAKIIIPHRGRNIQEVDSPTFEIILRYMYLERLDVTPENVASVLAAADFLQMENLKKACFDYLEQNLDQSNYETVKDIAGQFRNVALVQKADKFASLDSAQKELYERKYKAEKTLQTLSGFASVAGNATNSARSDLETIESRLKEGAEKELRLNLSNYRIANFLTDNVSDYFNHLLRNSQYDVDLGQVIIRKLQKMNPSRDTPAQLADTPFPSGFEITMIWESRRKFCMAVKNLKKRLRCAKRKYEYGREMITFQELLDKHVDAFHFTGGYYNRSGLENGNIRQAVDALFRGFSTEGVLLLKQWRLDYLVWRRLQNESTSLNLNHDHGTQARKAIKQILSNPRGSWR